MEGLTVVTVPVDCGPSPLVVKLALLLCGKGVVAQQLLNVGVHDITPRIVQVIK